MIQVKLYKSLRNIIYIINIRVPIHMYTCSICTVVYLYIVIVKFYFFRIVHVCTYMYIKRCEASCACTVLVLEFIKDQRPGLGSTN